MRNRLCQVITTGLFLVFLGACGKSESKGEEKIADQDLDKAINQIENLGPIQTEIEKQVLSDAIAVIRKHAELGNVDALYWMQDGRLLEPDDKNYVSLKMSLEFLQKAAKKGHAEAPLALAELYEKEVQDISEAYFWYYVSYFKKDGKVVDYNPDSKTVVPGDFRTESSVSSVVQKLGEKKVLAAEKKAKEWLKMFHKDDN